MKIRQIVCTAAGIVALAGFIGCAADRSHELSKGRIKDDKQITENVKDCLEHDPVYKFSEINVDTFGGIVQLSGFVNLEAEKQKAQSIASGVAGVVRVDNAITFKPAPVSPTGRTNLDNRVYSQ